MASTEFELKFGVPDDVFGELRAKLRDLQARSTQLRAIYFDTGSRELASAGLSLRLRREGAHWVQTLKAPAGRSFLRIEDEVGVGAKPEGVDPARHGEEAVAVLRKVLGLRKHDAWPALQPVFEVRTRRLAIEVREGATRVEIVLDEGDVRSGARKLPVREVEVELLQGHAGDALKVARMWRSRWGLWLHTSGKATRGAQLVSGDAFAPPKSADALRFGRKPRAGEFTAAVLANCLQQVIANAGELAHGSPADEHVHQLRVGLRRLRTALRELPMLSGERTNHEAPLVKVFRELGTQRDQGYVLRRLQPAIEAAGGIALHPPPGIRSAASPAIPVREDAFQDALLCLAGREHALRTLPGGRVKAMLRSRLARLHGRVAGSANTFTKLSPADQHGVRKRLKRLRYVAEFAAPLFPRAAVKRYLRGLKPAQERLGDLNDHSMALAIYREAARKDPTAQFGVDWLEAQRAADVKDARKALRKLAAARIFWESGG